MSFDFSQISGESFGDINDIFFKKNGKSIIPEDRSTSDGSKISVEDIARNVAETANQAKKGNMVGNTVIQISKDVIDSDEDLIVHLTELEEKRRTFNAVRNKWFIEVNTGEEVQIIEFTNMYNGLNLFTVKHSSTGKLITYPRSMFVGRTKIFVPKEFYIREAERALEDTVGAHYSEIKEILMDSSRLTETSDGRYLELLLDIPLDILNGIPVPDKVQIPVGRLFDLDYKLMMLEFVICLDNKVASLVFTDIWF
jgi:hypothetical protein